MAKKKETVDFMTEMEDKYNNLITTKTDTFDIIHTGSVSLDVALGVCGIPMGRFTEIYGAEGSGKTTLALSIAKQAILKGLKVLYCDPEQGLDMERVIQLVGEDVMNQEKFILVKPEYMEDALYICETAIESKEFGLVVLDSIASMAPRVVKEKGLEDSTMALIARKFGIFLTRNLYNVHENKVAFIGVNQVRDKFGAYYATFDTPGGHQWKHDCSIRIQLGKAEDIKQGTSKVGVIIRFVIKKNKLAPPFRTFTFPLMFDIGVDYYRDLMEFSKTMGVIKKFGGHYKLDDVVLGNGMNNSIEFLKTNKDTLDKLLEQCYSMTNQTITMEEDDEQELED